MPQCYQGLRFRVHDLGPYTLQPKVHLRLGSSESSGLQRNRDQSIGCVRG